jgi:hypothetical protein
VIVIVAVFLLQTGNYQTIGRSRNITVCKIIQATVPGSPNKRQEAIHVAKEGARCYKWYIANHRRDWSAHFLSSYIHTCTRNNVMERRNRSWNLLHSIPTMRYSRGCYDNVGVLAYNLRTQFQSSLLLFASESSSGFIWSSCLFNVTIQYVI